MSALWLESDATKQNGRCPPLHINFATRRLYSWVCLTVADGLTTLVPRFFFGAAVVRLASCWQIIKTIKTLCKWGETYQIVNFEDHHMAASTSDTRLHLIQHCVEGCNIMGGQPNDGPLCISIKFVSECCVPRINIHTCANTVVEISAGNIPLKEDLSTAQSVLMTNPLQRNRNCEAYSCIVNDTLAEILNFTHATGGKTKTDSQEPTLCCFGYEHRRSAPN